MTFHLDKYGREWHYFKGFWILALKQNEIKIPKNPNGLKNRYFGE